MFPGWNLIAVNAVNPVAQLVGGLKHLRDLVMIDEAEKYAVVVTEQRGTFTLTSRGS